MTESVSSASDQERRSLLRQVGLLRDQRLNLDRQLRSATQRNQKLAEALQEARADMLRLKQALAQDLEAPMNQATVLQVNPARTTAASLAETPVPAAVAEPTLDVLLGGRPVRVPVSPLLDLQTVRTGMLVLLNESMGACAVLGYRSTGETASVREVLDEDRLVLGTANNVPAVARRSGALQETELKAGDAVLHDPAAGLALSLVPRTDAEELVLEETPTTTFADIGGLTAQIEQIRDAVELPFLHPDLYREHDLRAPKGILLYGPPGNGKTLIARAVATSLAERMSPRASGPAVGGCFFNVKGPELLDKFVGETERQIRAVFSRAREKARSGHPVVVFFDEMEALFRTRGAGKSSDVETTIVPQLLAEIDGVETLDNVIVVGATNREDMIDPAVLRPGRLDVKVRIDRPDREGTAQIFRLYVREDLPLAQDEVDAAGGDRARTVAGMVSAVVDELFAEDSAHRFVDAVLADGRRVPTYWKDFLSGALVRNVVDRAKKLAIKEFLETGTKGLRTGHLLASARAEFEQQRDALSRADVEDWLKGLDYSVALASVERPEALGTGERNGRDR